MKPKQIDACGPHDVGMSHMMWYQKLTADSLFYFLNAIELKLTKNTDKINALIFFVI